MASREKPRQTPTFLLSWTLRWLNQVSLINPQVHHLTSLDLLDTDSEMQQAIENVESEGGYGSEFDHGECAADVRELT